MKELKIRNETVRVDVDKFSKGLAKMHTDDPEKAVILKFGMLDAKIIEIFEIEFTNDIRLKFKDDYYLHEDEIERFIKATKKEIIHGIYKYGNLVV